MGREWVATWLHTRWGDVRVAEPKSKGASVGYACGEQWAVLRLHWRGVTPMRVARCVSCRSRGGDGDRGSGADDRAPHERERERERRKDQAAGMWPRRSEGRIGSTVTEVGLRVQPVREKKRIWIFGFILFQWRRKGI
jgi:hypothetical protein